MTGHVHRKGFLGVFFVHYNSFVDEFHTFVLQLYMFTDSGRDLMEVISSVHLKWFRQLLLLQVHSLNSTRHRIASSFGDRQGLEPGNIRKSS
uniref:Uncharacterized protein n=1 Tax=Physcomitrium patens TaxID=3218 RepID=A0A2K1KFV4_PHYPA|nr:hypothetical protein PHYPA_009038 [Physcomitrium patens]